MIRDFVAADLENIRKLLLDTPEAVAWSAHDLLDAAHRGVVLRVVTQDGNVGGFVAFRITADEAEILNLAVDVAQRRRGIATRLIDDAIAAFRAAGASRVFLEVRDSNQAARTFYARMGFTEAGRRRQYYRRPLEDALLLVRKIE